MKVAVYICCFVIWFFCGVLLNGKVSFYGMKLGNYFLFVTAGVFGSVSFVGLCKLIKNIKLKGFLTKTADNAIIIIGTHNNIRRLF